MSKTQITEMAQHIAFGLVIGFSFAALVTSIVVVATA